MKKAILLPKNDPLWRFSNPEQVQKNAGNLVVYKSQNKTKKYAIIHNGLRINFGGLGYEDFTKHHDPKRRLNYLMRSAKAGHQDPYSPNELARRLLWK